MFAMVFVRIHQEVIFANATRAIKAMLPSQMDVLRSRTPSQVIIVQYVQHIISETKPFSLHRLLLYCKFFLHEYEQANYI